MNVENGLDAFPGLMTYSQVSQELNVTPQRILQLINNGELKRIQFGRSKALITRLSVQQLKDQRAWFSSNNGNPMPRPKLNDWKQELRRQLGIKRRGPNRMTNRARLETILTLISLGLFTGAQNERILETLPRIPYWRAYHVNCFRFAAENHHPPLPITRITT